MELLNKHFWKFLAGFIGIMILGFAALFGAQYLHYKKNGGDAQVNGEKYFSDLQKKYEEDTYGGKTPEETLALFIAALKKGDTDLAAKYFVVDKQEEWREKLEKANLTAMITDAQKLKLAKKNGDSAFFTIANENKVVEVEVVLGLGQNGIWKIIEL